MEEKYGRLYLDGKLSYPRDIMGKYVSEGQTITVIIRGNERHKPPHFHLSSESGDLKCCVGIYEPIYVPHKKFKSRLSEQQIEDMVKWLLQHEENLYHTGLNSFNNWVEIREFWNAIEGNRIQPEREEFIHSIQFPDYSKLNGGK